MRLITDRLKDDKLVAMFPEGHVVVDGTQTDIFKSGMVLMSAMSRKPIIPIYVAPRAHFYSRIHTVVGEPVDIVTEGGAMPSLVQIEEITAALREHEERLRQIYEEKRKHQC